MASPLPSTAVSRHRQVYGPSFVSKYVKCVFALCLTLSSIVGYTQNTPPSKEKRGPIPSDIQLFEEFGRFIGAYTNLAELNLTPEELRALQRGIAATAIGAARVQSDPSIKSKMESLVAERRAKYTQKRDLELKQIISNAAYFTKLVENKAIVASPSGLHFQIVSEGIEPKPSQKDLVKYRGLAKLLNGNTTSTILSEGADFVPMDQLLPGVREGICKIGKGGRIILHLPPKLAFGNLARGDVPPNSIVICEVELIAISTVSARLDEMDGELKQMLAEAKALKANRAALLKKEIANISKLIELIQDGESASAYDIGRRFIKDFEARTGKTVFRGSPSSVLEAFVEQQKAIEAAVKVLGP